MSSETPNPNEGLVIRLSASSNLMGAPLTLLQEQTQHVSALASNSSLQQQVCDYGMSAGARLGNYTLHNKHYEQLFATLTGPRGMVRRLLWHSKCLDEQADESICSCSGSMHVRMQRL